MKDTETAGKRIPTGVKGLFAFCVMLLIFCHSAMPADLSSQESGVVVALLLRALPFSDPSRYADLLTFLVRKTAHVTEYTLLGLSFTCYLWDVMKQRAASGAGRIVLTAWLCGVLYAVTDEIHQYFVPGRSCEIRDVLIDAAGLLLGGWIVYGLYEKHTDSNAHEERS